jgi:3-oxoacyl-[acyl-carrier-protein] synthase-3
MEASTGIRSRWYAPDDWAASDLALRAALQALERAGKRPEDVDLIILGTDSPDYITPATSVVLQAKLGAKNAGTFDVACACASFPTAMSNAAGLMATNPGLKTVLVVAVYQMHKLSGADDPMLFFYGDGAGAAVLERNEAQGFIAAAFQADGTYAKKWLIQAGGTVEPASELAVREGRTSVKMVERYPPEINNEGWPRLVRKVAENGGFAVSDIDFVIFTQVRKPTIELVMKSLDLPMEKTHMIMEQWGYTGSACIPMALDDALQQKKIKPGDLVVMVGSGVGYNQAAAAFRMPLEEKRLFGD